MCLIFIAYYRQKNVHKLNFSSCTSKHMSNSNTQIPYGDTHMCSFEVIGGDLPALIFVYSSSSMRTKHVLVQCSVFESCDELRWPIEQSVTSMARGGWLPARHAQKKKKRNALRGERLRWSGENPIHTCLKRSTVRATMGAFLSFMWHRASKVSEVQETHDFYLKIYKLWKWMPLCLFVLLPARQPRGLALPASCQPISAPQKP